VAKEERKRRKKKKKKKKKERKKRKGALWPEYVCVFEEVVCERLEHGLPAHVVGDGPDRP
jgi:hypothetical protein